VASDGTVAAQSSGASPVGISAPVSTGSYTLQVSGQDRVSFTVTVTYPNP